MNIGSIIKVSLFRQFSRSEPTKIAQLGVPTWLTNKHRFVLCWKALLSQVCMCRPMTLNVVHSEVPIRWFLEWLKKKMVEITAVHYSAPLSTYDSVEDLTYVWRTQVWKNYLGMKIIQNDTQSNVFLGNFAHTFWFWHLKASVMCIFLDFCNFMAKFGQKSLFWSDIFFDNAIWSMRKQQLCY